MIKFFNNKGQSILEVILAVAIFGLIASSLMALVTGGFTAMIQGGEQTEAELLAQEAIEGVRSIRDAAWNNLIYVTSSIGRSGNRWIFSSENTTETIGKFTRNISFAPVCRDVSNNFTNCPGSYTDIQSKKVTVTVTWNTTKGETNQVQQSTYLTNWDSREWLQTDWLGGSGQALWADTTQYSSDDGNIDNATAGEIALGAAYSVTSLTSTWPLSIASDYLYNNTKIQISSGFASLLDQGSGNFCSGSPNACNTFLAQPNCLSQTGCAWTGGSSGSSPAWSTAWGTYYDWENGGNANGTRPTSGGNPTNYIDIAISRNKNAQTASGYWQQSFTTAASNPETATLNFEWSIKNFNSSYLTNYTIYVFVDNFSGAPIIGSQVWSQAVTGVTGWVSVSNLDVSPKLTAAGTYYIKLVARRIKPAGTPPNVNNAVGWDNVSLNWFKSGSCSGTAVPCNTLTTQPTCTGHSACSWSLAANYPTDSPTASPITSLFPGGAVNYWSGFSETAEKNGGEIFYQLSSDDGLSWQYWNGGSWAAVTGPSDYNTANIIASNISSFTTSTAEIKFKAFLKSDGSQLVRLDSVQIGYNYTAISGNYVGSGSFVSSAYNTGLSSSKVQVLEWDETKPVGSDIRLQIRTAPDFGGSPGSWTAWYGTTGADTYFSNHVGSIIPAAINGNKWLQYRAELSGNDLITPLLQEVRVNYK